MKKRIVIDNCIDCPFFIDAFAISDRETCKKVHKEIPYNLTDRGYPIPDFCPLPNDSENDLIDIMEGYATAIQTDPEYSGRSAKSFLEHKKSKT
jgi:hypothetical protein